MTKTITVSENEVLAARLQVDLLRDLGRDVPEALLRIANAPRRPRQELAPDTSTPSVAATPPGVTAAPTPVVLRDVAGHLFVAPGDDVVRVIGALDDEDAAAALAALVQRTGSDPGMRLRVLKRTEVDPVLSERLKSLADPARE